MSQADRIREHAIRGMSEAEAPHESNRTLRSRVGHRLASLAIAPLRSANYETAAWEFNPPLAMRTLGKKRASRLGRRIYRVVNNTLLATEDKFATRPMAYGRPATKYKVAEDPTREDVDELDTEQTPEQESPETIEPQVVPEDSSDTIDTDAKAHNLHQERQRRRRQVGGSVLGALAIGAALLSPSQQQEARSVQTETSPVPIATAESLQPSTTSGADKIFTFVSTDFASAVKVAQTADKHEASAAQSTNNHEKSSTVTEETDKGASSSEAKTETQDEERFVKLKSGSNPWVIARGLWSEVGGGYSKDHNQDIAAIKNAILQMNGLSEADSYKLRSGSKLQVPTAKEIRTILKNVS